MDGTLQGDLVVRGSGDPSLNARQVYPVAVLDGWADQLAARGIRRIAGRLVGDDNAFDEQSFGQGWSWDDLQDGYSAPDRRAAGLRGRGHAQRRARRQRPARQRDVAFATPGSGWAIDNRAVTGAPGHQLTIDARRTPGALLVHVTGSIPSGSAVITRSLAVDNPTAYLLGLLAAALERRGITIARRHGGYRRPPARQRGARGRAAGRSTARPRSARSPSPLMKASQNLYGGDAAPRRRAGRRTCRNRSRRQGGRAQRVEGVGRSSSTGLVDGRRLRAVALQLRDR